MVQPFVINGICHPYNFSEENLGGRFGHSFNDVLYTFRPLLNPLRRRSLGHGRLPNER